MVCVHIKAISKSFQPNARTNPLSVIKFFFFIEPNIIINVLNLVKRSFFRLETTPFTFYTRTKMWMSFNERVYLAYAKSIFANFVNEVLLSDFFSRLSTRCLKKTTYSVRLSQTLHQIDDIDRWSIFSILCASFARVAAKVLRLANENIYHNKLLSCVNRFFRTQINISQRRLFLRTVQFFFDASVRLDYFAASQNLSSNLRTWWCTQNIYDWFGFFIKNAKTYK